MGGKARKRKGMYRYLTFSLLILMFSILLAVTTYSGQFEDAEAALERGDYATAFRLIKPLAEQGHAEAQYNIGLMYESGNGVLQDYVEAAKWFGKAAEQGVISAQISLGVMYAVGDRVPQDYILAHMWFTLAASQSSATKEKEKEIAIKNRDSIASMMTPAQIAKAERLAREWKPKKEMK